MRESLYMDRFSYPVLNLGPGKRIGMWVQGCSRNCRGCMSTYLKHKKEQNLQPIDMILANLRTIAPEFDGITISGGEPFDQASVLSVLLIKVRKFTNLDILVYSGYTLEEIKSGSNAMKTMLDQIDILIDGPFIIDMPNTKIWRGSDNQMLHLLTGRSQKYRAFVDKLYTGKRQLQIDITENNQLHITGIPERKFFQELNKIATQHGVRFQEISDVNCLT